MKPDAVPNESWCTVDDGLYSSNFAQLFYCTIDCTKTQKCVAKLTTLMLCYTRSSAIADGPRDAMCRSKSSYLLRKSQIPLDAPDHYFVGDPSRGLRQSPLGPCGSPKYLRASITKLMAVQNVRIGIVWAIRGHSKSSAERIRLPIRL